MLIQRQQSVLPLVLRAVLWGGALVALLAAAAFGLAYSLARESIPEYSGTRTVSGLHNPVSIVRTEHAVPHVFGETDEDVFFGLGYAHAQDRLWQMLIARATVQGRLSERFGRRSIGLDRRMRILGLRHAAERNLASLPPDSVAVLEAYSRGVNAYLHHIQTAPIGRGAPELFLFSTGAIERWTPADSIGIVKLMSLRLSGDAQRELEHGRFAALLPGSLLQSLYPPYPDAAVTTPGDSEPEPVEPEPAGLPGIDVPRGADARLGDPPGDADPPEEAAREDPAQEDTRDQGAARDEAAPQESSAETGSAEAEASVDAPGEVSPAEEAAAVPGEPGGGAAPDGAEEALELGQPAPGPVDEPPPASSPPVNPLPFPAEPDATRLSVPWLDSLVPGGSNAWAAGGSRSTSKKPLLANDPHLGFSAPGIWYLARLRLRDHDVIGATIPGLPIVAVGRNAQLGWGLTSAYVDDQDIYFNEIDETAPNIYRTKDGFAPLRVHTERIYIRGVSEPLVETVRATHHGPVLPTDLYSVAAAIPEGTIASMRWTALETDDWTVVAGLDLMRSASIAEALEAVRNFSAPAQNVTLADADGIAFVVAGRVPLRDALHETRGRLPSAGWKRQNEWIGYIPYEQLPKSIDPAGGLIANANNRTTNAAFPWNITSNWASPYRMRRLQDLLQERDFHTVESFARIQADAVSYVALSLLSHILDQVRFHDVPSPNVHRLRGSALDRLQRWNGEMDAARPEPLIFTAWMRHLSDELLQNWIGEEAGVRLPFRPMFLEQVFLASGENSPWCDDQVTSSQETCRFAALKALDAALEELTAEYGSNLDGWQWGRAHGAIHRHLPLGFTSPISALFNIRHDYGGSNFTLSRAGSSGAGEEPYATVSGAGYRAIYDMANPERSRFVAATGQSGHFLSQHYDDLTAIWKGNQYLPMELSLPKDIKRTAGTLYLVPVAAESPK